MRSPFVAASSHSSWLSNATGLVRNGCVSSKLRPVYDRDSNCRIAQFWLQAPGSTESSSTFTPPDLTIFSALSSAFKYLSNATLNVPNRQGFVSKYKSDVQLPANQTCWKCLAVSKPDTWGIWEVVGGNGKVYHRGWQGLSPQMKQHVPSAALLLTRSLPVVQVD